MLPFFQVSLFLPPGCFVSLSFFFFFLVAFRIISSSSCASTTSISSPVSPRSEKERKRVAFRWRAVALELLRIRFESGYQERFDNIKTSSWRGVVRNKARYCLAILVRPVTLGQPRVDPRHLHHQTAAAVLLWRVRILALGNNAPH